MGWQSFSALSYQTWSTFDSSLPRFPSEIKYLGFRGYKKSRFFLNIRFEKFVELKGYAYEWLWWPHIKFITQT